MSRSARSLLLQATIAAAAVLMPAGNEHPALARTPGLASRLGAEGQAVRLEAPREAGRAELLRSWQERYREPREYIASKFEDFRWVILGEYHRVLHDVQLVVDLVPLLHARSDVRHLALEFLCRDRSEEANRLITAASYDRAEMIDFFRAQFPGWGYEEYLAILHSAWQSNRDHAAERGPFRLVGLHPCIDWEVIHYGSDPAHVQAERSKQRRYDEIMAEALEESVLKPGHKALVFTGIAHATGKFAEYRMGTDEQLMRMGNLVYRDPYKTKMFFIALHAPFYDHARDEEIYPFDGVLDELMLGFGRDIGFDVIGTPFAGLAHRQRSERSITAYTFGELYDGYVIFRTPIKQYQGVTCIPDWVESEEELRQFARGLSNKRASEMYAAMSLKAFLAERCTPRPDHGKEFHRRFRRLRDVRSGPPG